MASVARQRMDVPVPPSLPDFDAGAGTGTWSIRSVLVATGRGCCSRVEHQNMAIDYRSAILFLSPDLNNTTIIEFHMN